MNTLQKVFKHLSLISRHKWVVFKLCCKVGEVKRGILHDLSKYSWTEFSESVKYYNGTHSPITECKKANGYSKAWLHHKGRNKHHHEYWYDYSAPMATPLMPYNYIVEMICDTLAAGMAYNGKNWTNQTQLDYYLEDRKKKKINPVLDKILLNVYEEVSVNGIKKTITKKNIKKIYDECVKDEVGNINE